MNSQIEGRKFVNSIGMVMTLVSFSMLFATMFLGFAVFRLTANTWPPMGMEKVHLLIPTISTCIIFVSSIFLYHFEIHFKEFSLSKRRLFLLATFIFGLLFLGSQVNLWHSLQVKGIYAESGIFPSLIYAFTWVHAAHIILGLLALLYLSTSIIQENFDEIKILKIQNVCKFWHFLGFMWLIIYLTIFVF